MTDPWTFAGEPTVTNVTGGSRTLVEGASFAISSANGDMEPAGAQGLFFEDTRFVSVWRMRLDEKPPQGLAVVSETPFSATFLSRGSPIVGESDSTLLVERSRYVGNGMREDVVVHNFGRELAACSVHFELDADFAHLFEVKEQRLAPHTHHSVETVGQTMTFAFRNGALARQLDVVFPTESRLSPGRADIDILVAPGEAWRTTLEFRLRVDDKSVDLRYGRDAPVEQSTPVARLRAWDEGTTQVRTDSEGVNATLEQSRRDLGALRIFDPDHDDRAVIAAGAPWFMTLFGRDSLLTSLMTLILDPAIAASTLLTLARFQGTQVDPDTEEAPGKILHEMRRGITTAADPLAGSVYYGSVDATPLFVIVLGELTRWGVGADVVSELLPHADRALAWLTDFGDADGDGFVEYHRSNPRGLVNQGWKDSFDALSFADGRLAEAPIALCEVQGYAYRAFLARADIARCSGDDTTAHVLEERAARLKVIFNSRFWLEEQGFFAIGLDADKQPIDSLSSNVGHCLWSGIVDDDKASRIAERLCSPEMFTGWGIRTLATTMARYNPVSYHNGSVWPHDSAICAAGLARYGFTEAATTLSTGLFDAAEAFGGRLPELFCGFDRQSYPIPIPYPASCSPQAWASASPYWLLREVLLGLNPSLPDPEIVCRPSIPRSVGTVRVDNLLLAGARVSIEATAAAGVIHGLGGGSRW